VADDAVVGLDLDETDPMHDFAVDAQYGDMCRHLQRRRGNADDLHGGTAPGSCSRSLAEHGETLRLLCTSRDSREARN
jgi:hypothetical protein